LIFLIYSSLNYMQSLGVREQVQTVSDATVPEQQQPMAEEQPQQPQFQNDLEINRNEEREDDWLSLLHNLCSFLILFSIIYFYSSFTRFLMVFGVVVLLFL
jgi:hypothetical protein